MDNEPFDERVAEIEAYIRLLESLERAAQTGPPQINGDVITTRQQKMLYSAVYLQLYNLVEATATRCVTAVSQATATSGSWNIGQLELPIRQEWVRRNARTHVVLNADKRLKTALEFCNLILDGGDISEWTIEKGGGGNWDVAAIEDICERIGCILQISDPVQTAAKRHFRDDMNALAFVKDLRNKLAHGSISFEQSGDNVTVSDLKELKKRTVDYLREVIQSFSDYLDGFMFLDAAVRPVQGGS
jgi:hypothetical protein